MRVAHDKPQRALFEAERNGGAAGGRAWALAHLFSRQNRAAGGRHRRLEVGERRAVVGQLSIEPAPCPKLFPCLLRSKTGRVGEGVRLGLGRARRGRPA